MELVERRGTLEIYQVTIFCDDLFICPRCAWYHPHRRTPEYDCPWLFDRDSRIDHEMLQRTIDTRRHAPEFILRKCERQRCAEVRQRVIESMKARDDAEARTAAFNAELSKRQLTPLPSP